MNLELIRSLYYTKKNINEIFQYPSVLESSLQLISDFFERNTTKKLCIVFSSKEYASQWLSIPLVLSEIKNDFDYCKDEIRESYKHFRPGDKLLLNNEAVVIWLGIKDVYSRGRNKKVAVFGTKTSKRSSNLEISIHLDKITKLQRTNRNVLSSQDKVMSVLPKQSITPLDQLLQIDTYGNKEFIKNKVCLITKYKSFSDSIDSVALNLKTLPDYFPTGKISDDGIVDINSPLLIANNLSNLALYSVTNPISKIIIDGFSAIQERGTDFSDIDVKGIPTILITDLSEIDSFEFISNYGFEFFNFTKENLNLDQQSDNSPFHALHKKHENYIHFKFIKEICQDNDLEIITQKIHSIEKDDSNNDLNILKVHLIQLTNLVSRICHTPKSEEINSFNQKLCSIENLFKQARLWLGDSHKPIEESIILLKSVVEKHAWQPSEKCVRLESLLKQNSYNYIICPTEDEAQALKTFLPSYTKIQVISIADVNDNLLTDNPVTAIITGWAKSSNINRILSSFLFSELTALFYQFENKYYNSLQRRNRKWNENIKSTINKNGIRLSGDHQKPDGFADLYSDNEVLKTTSESSFDIHEFESQHHNTQYSKYITKGNFIDSIKAKRVEFENDCFIYSSESHKFLVIDELIKNQFHNTILHKRKLDSLKLGDVTALINTDRDILAELVEKNTNKQELAAIKQWTELWKSLLKEYFAITGYDFKKLVDELRKNDCKKHEVTIKAWLLDPTRIGPDDDADLISIALLTGSNLLNDNINNVREAITKMRGLRHEASDLVIQKITTKIHEFDSSSIVNKRISIEGLGSVTISKVITVSNVWENIDVRYANKLLQKETI